MIRDQATALRQLALGRTPVRKAQVPGVPLIVVAGGLRGVGTSTVAFHLAVGLARQGRRTVWVDADLESGGRIERGSQRDHGDIRDVLTGVRSVHEVLSRGPCGVQIVSGKGDASLASAPAQERLIGQLRSLAPHVDVVIVDAGNSRSPFACRFWRTANLVVAVTTPEDEAVLSCYSSIKTMMAGDGGGTVSTLVNHANDEQIAESVQSRMAAACRRFLSIETVRAGWFPASPDFQRSSSGVVANSTAGQAFERVADEVWPMVIRGNHG